MMQSTSSIKRTVFCSAVFQMPAGPAIYCLSKMASSYVSEVRKFGGSRPYLREDGTRYNLMPWDSFLPDEVETDGKGNIRTMPLLRKRPCFARPERFIRGALEQGSVYGDEDEFGEKKRGETKCERCPVFDACHEVAEERIDSNPLIRNALDSWSDACEQRGLRSGSPLRYYPGLRKLWDDFLDAIIAHGGWSSCYDENLKLHEMQKSKEEKRKAKDDRKRRKAKLKAAQLSGAQPLTTDFLDALQAERDRRAVSLKGFRKKSTAGREIKRLQDTSCNRIADVWQAREVLRRVSEEPTGVAITKWMVINGMDHGLIARSLQSRVSEDLKRIESYQKDRGSGALWPVWNYEEP